MVTLSQFRAIYSCAGSVGFAVFVPSLAARCCYGHDSRGTLCSKIGLLKRMNSAFIRHHLSRKKRDPGPLQTSYFSQNRSVHATNQNRNFANSAASRLTARSVSTPAPPIRERLFGALPRPPAFPVLR